MKKQIYFCLSAIFLLLVSCNKEGTESPIWVSTPKVDSNKTGDILVLGKKLNNPYSLTNMQAAYDSLVFKKTEGKEVAEHLHPNCLYVRFLPKDSADIRTLQDLDLELFEYPLDYEIEIEGDSYHDPSIPEGMTTWYYTTVNTDFEFPSIDYQVLEECFIPTRAEGSNQNLAVDAEELEILAIKNADLPDKYQPINDVKAFGLGKKPEGTIKVMNDSKSIIEGIRGVKVRCHYFVNISSTYTSESGYYKISNRYVCNPHYAIVFENMKDFVIWGNFAFIAAANHNMGYHSNTGYSTTVQTSSNGWKWAVINNTAYDYYKQCAQEGILTPPSKLKIWCWPNVSSSSAPMLHHLIGVNCSGFATTLVSVLIAGTVTPAAAAISAAEYLIGFGLPDITIGMSGNNRSPHKGYSHQYNIVWHELTHASHFRQAGEAVWGPYIDYIVWCYLRNQGTYGDGTATSVGRDICELGESWAYANEFLVSGADPNDFSRWFKDSFLGIYNIQHEGTLTRKQMYDCLTSDVKSIGDFKDKLIDRYPNKTSEINAQL